MCERVLELVLLESMCSHICGVRGAWVGVICVSAYTTGCVQMKMHAYIWVSLYVCNCIYMYANNEARRMCLIVDVGKDYVSKRIRECCKSVVHANVGEGPEDENRKPLSS